jgi:hypothetical protein
MKMLRAGAKIVDDKGHLIGTTKRTVSLENPVFLSDLDVATRKRGEDTATVLRLAVERMRKDN